MRNSRARKNRVAGLMASAVIFGSISGGAMVSVNLLAEQYLTNSQTAAAEYRTEGDAAVSRMAMQGVSSEGSLMTSVEEDQTAIKTAVNSESAGDVYSVSEIVEKAMPSVVSITNTIQYQLNGYAMFGGGQSQTAEAAASGSGVIIGKTDSELLIVTNHHVVEDASKLSVQFIDESNVEAEVKGYSDSADIALIAIPLDNISQETLDAIAVAEFGDSEALYVGDQVVAIGNALGYGQSVTSGIISAKDRDISTSEGTETGLLQTDAAINPGNSGGALLDMQGKLIGINVAKYSSEEVEGMGYSIPSAQVEEIVAELSQRTTRTKVSQEEQGSIGIQAKTVDSTTAEAYGMPRGIYVYKIIENSAAANSALQEKDIITSFDGQSITGMEELSSLLERYQAGESVTIKVQRLSAGGVYEEKEIVITLGEKA